MSVDQMVFEMSVNLMVFDQKKGRQKKIGAPFFEFGTIKISKFEIFLFSRLAEITNFFTAVIYTEMQ
jgi:hypothetical protein